jgi:hypothetical protein
VAPLSDQLIGVILNSKKDVLPNTLANAMLLKMKDGKAGAKTALQLFFKQLLRWMQKKLSLH